MSDNRLMLAQVRRGYRDHIAQSPTTVTVTRYGTKDDGMGNQVVDMTNPVQKSFIVRISRERAAVPEVHATPAGLDTSMAQYMLAPWDADIQENDNIGAWRVGRVTNLTKFGGIVAKEAPLITQTDAGTEYVEPTT